MNRREVIEGLLLQGADEQIAYTITTTPWASTPTVTGVVAFDITDGKWIDVSATVLSGVASVLGDVITCPILKSLSEGRMYRIEVKFTASGNTFEPYFVVKGEH